MPGCGCAGANVPAGWLGLWGGLGGQQDRSCLTAAAISCPQHPAPGSERFRNTRARKGNSEAMPGKWGKSPCCVLCPGSCDELSTVSAWFGLSLVRSQPIVGAAKPPSAPHLGAVAPNETRGKAGRGRASPEQTPFANMGCGQDPGSGQGWPWHWAGSRARQQERQGFPHPACGIARAPSLGTLGIIPPLGLSSLGVPGVFWGAMSLCVRGGGGLHAELPLHLFAEGQDDSHPKAAPKSLSRCWHHWCMPDALSLPAHGPLLLSTRLDQHPGVPPPAPPAPPWRWSWGPKRCWT